MNGILKSQSLWTSINPVPAAYPWLTEDITADIAIFGGGVTGALCALRLQNEGFDTVLLSGTPIGYSDVSVGSGTAQYEIPGGISRLAERIGIEKAVKAFSLCRDGMDELEALVHELDCDCGCRRSDSLLFTAQESELADLREEYLLRKHNGFEVDYLAHEQAGDLFSFAINAGIVSKRMSLSIDPYRFTHAILANAASHGVRIFENTGIQEVSCARDCQQLITNSGKKVRCGRLVLASGTRIKSIIPYMGGTRTSFAVATEPVSIFVGWPGKCVISNFSGNINLSVTSDNRIIAMGLDSRMAGMSGKLSGMIPVDAFYEKKYIQLGLELERMFPGIRETQPEVCFTTNYPATHNDLPTIGVSHVYPGCILAICSGISGLAFAPIAARHVSEIILGKDNPDHSIFSSR